MKNKINRMSLKEFKFFFFEELSAKVLHLKLNL